MNRDGFTIRKPLCIIWIILHYVALHALNPLLLKQLCIVTETVSIALCLISVLSSPFIIYCIDMLHSNLILKIISESLKSKYV